MDAILANVLGPLSRKQPSLLDEALVNQSEQVLSQEQKEVRTPTVPGAPAPALEDSIEVLGKHGRPPAMSSGIDLYSMLEGMRGPTAGGGQADAFSTQISSMSSFSFQASFASLTQTTGRLAEGGGISELLGGLDQAYQDLMSYDPDQAGRLSILARVLAALNPEGAEHLLKTMHDTLTHFMGLGARLEGAKTPSGPPPEAPTPSQQPQEPPGQTVTTEMVHFELDFEMERSVEVNAAIAELRDNGINVKTVSASATEKIKFHVEFTGIRQTVQQADPLVLDLNGDGIDLSSAAEGQMFDINADGKTDKTGFVRGDDAFLALDRNQNGLIDSGAELFGDQHGAANGFDELAKYDDNADGRIDSRDMIYNNLRLLHDRDGDGRVGMGETSTLAEQGIEGIDLGYTGNRLEDDGKGNTLAEQSNFYRADGSTGKIHDAWVGYYA